MDTEFTTQKEPVKREVDNTVLSSGVFYQHDPFLMLLKDKLHLGTAWIVTGGFVLVGLFILSLLVFTSIFNHYLRTHVALGGIFNLLLVDVGINLSLLAYLLLPTAMVSVFNTLKANGVIGPSHQKQLGSVSYDGFLEHVVSWMDNKWWSIILAMLSILYCLYFNRIANPNLLTIPPLLLLVGCIIGVMIIYIIFFLFLRFILLMIFVNQLFLLFTIRVRPLHPDGSGGLAVSSQLWWMGAAIMFVTALIFISVPGYLSAPLSPLEIIAVMVVYLILITALAIGWLALPHHVMVLARNEHLQPLAEEYERVLMETKPTAEEETSKILAGTERLSALKQRYELVRDTFPTWPLQIVEMTRLGVALLLPALISLLPALFDMFTKK